VENLVVETESGSATQGSPVLITDLHNYGMPFIRYRIGDVAIMQDGSCACGRGLPRIRSIEGRVLDALRTKDGRIVPGEFFPHLMKDIPEVREFQVRQESLDRICLSVVLSAELSERSRSLLQFEVGRIFGDSASVIIQPVDAIPRLASGKRRVTIGLGV
jgi:phenylacetate-CoA ligase